MSADDKDRTPQRPEQTEETGDQPQLWRTPDGVADWTIRRLQEAFSGSTWADVSGHNEAGLAGYTVERDPEADHGVSAIVSVWPGADESGSVESGYRYVAQALCVRNGSTIAHVAGPHAATAALAGELLRVRCIEWLAATVAGDWPDELKDATSVLAGLCGVSLASLVAEAFNLQAPAPDAEAAAEVTR